MHPQFLSNTYLVGEPGGPASSSTRAAREPAHRRGRAPRHDADPRAAHPPSPRPRRRAGKLTARWPDLEVLRHPDERVDGVTGEMGPDETVAVGDSSCHPPGHTKGMLSLLVEGNVFNGDTLFKNSVGGVRPRDTATPTSSTRSWTCCSPPARDRHPPGPHRATTSPTNGSATLRARLARADPRATSRAPRWASRHPRLLRRRLRRRHKAWVRWPDGPTTSSPARRSSGARGR
jgi:hypothetical protein